MLRSRALAPFLLSALFGCDQYPAAQTSGCGTNTAMVGIKDNYLLVECGCDEKSGTTQMDGNPLTCTVPAGTWVVFDMTNANHIHQVVSVGTPSFASGPVRDPSNDSSPLNHVVQFSTLGTYQFQDRYEVGLSGKIVAR